MKVGAALPQMQALASRIWTRGSRHHPGQLSWGVHYAEGLAGTPVELARVAGEVVGGAWAESETWLEICVDPSIPRSRLIVETPAYPVPGRIYRSIGFRPGPRTVTLTRPAE